MILRFTGQGAGVENPSLVLTWDLLGHLVQVDKTIDTVVYRKTLTWTGDQLTNVSEWVKL